MINQNELCCNLAQTAPCLVGLPTPSLQLEHNLLLLCPLFEPKSASPARFEQDDWHASEHRRRAGDCWCIMQLTQKKDPRQKGSESTT